MYVKTNYSIMYAIFVPGNSKSLIKKFRRRSAIGARGSPENNSLIQYIACQKRKGMENPSMQVGVQIFVEGK